MSDGSTAPLQVVTFVEKLIDGELSTQQFHELESLLVADAPQACELYADLLMMHAHLQHVFGGGHAERPKVAARSPAARETSPVRSRLMALRAGLSMRALASILLLWACGWGLFGISIRSRPPKPREVGLAPLAPVSLPVAHITQASAAKWAAETESLEVGAALLPGQQLELEGGWIALETSNGVKVQLHGPARLLVSPEDLPSVAGAMHLHEGRLMAQVPRQAHGFTVRTDSVTVVDLGTEFGVRVAPSIEVEVHVNAGRVMTYTGHSLADRRQQVLEAGQSLRVDSRGEASTLAQAEESDFASVKTDAPPELKVDFGSAPAVLQSGFQPFFRDDITSSSQSGVFDCAFGQQGVITVRVATDDPRLVWRTRKEWPLDSECNLVRGFVTSPAHVYLSFEGLPAGDYRLTTYHHDMREAYGTMRVSVEDKAGTRRVVVPELAHSGQRPKNVQISKTNILFAANGIDLVRVHFDKLHTEHVLINGFVLERLSNP